MGGDERVRLSRKFVKKACSQSTFGRWGGAEVGKIGRGRLGELTKLYLFIF